MNSTPQREFWNGQPVQLETVCTLTKRGHVAQCAGDRGVRGGLREAMLEKGWTTG